MKADFAESVSAYLLDTNVLLRFITGLPEEQFDASRELFVRAERGEIHLLLTAVIAAETLYVLESFYKVGRADIAKSLMPIIGSTRLRIPERSVLLGALDYYQETNLAFADCYIAAAAIKDGASVVTFDKGIRKIKQLVVVTPPGR